MSRGADALEDNPPFDNSAMDGYALIAADTVGASSAAPVSLRVVDEIPAGKAPTIELTRGCAARIMTGAMMPPGADAVVIIELTETDGGHAQIQQAAKLGQNIRLRGESVRAGERVLEAETLLGPAECAMLAALNIAEAHVYRKPRAAVLFHRGRTDRPRRAAQTRQNTRQQPVRFMGADRRGRAAYPSTSASPATTRRKWKTKYAPEWNKPIC